MVCESSRATVDGRAIYKTGYTIQLLPNRITSTGITGRVRPNRIKIVNKVSQWSLRTYERLIRYGEDLEMSLTSLINIIGGEIPVRQRNDAYTCLQLAISQDRSRTCPLSSVPCTGFWRRQPTEARITRIVWLPYTLFKNPGTEYVFEISVYNMLDPFYLSSYTIHSWVSFFGSSYSTNMSSTPAVRTQYKKMAVLQFFST